MGRVLGIVLRFLVLLLLCNLLGFGAWFLHARQGWSRWEVGALFLGMAVVLLSAFMARRLYFRYREQRFIRKLVEHDGPRPESDDEAERMASLRRRWQRGLTMLRQAQGLKGDPVYGLPWFMVFGESGSGKSTAISHARLSASASDAGPLAHVTDTRNCDWWFFDRAVVLDTAGRYAVPIHEEADRREWEEFLRLLAAHRRREPLNGLVLTLSAEQLQERDETALADYGRCLRRRMQSMVQALGASFRVYLLVTKMDRVLGMTALAGLLSRTECRQALGLLDRDETGPAGQESAGDFLERALAHVVRRLQDLSLLLLAQADGNHVQAAVLPEELYRLAPGIRAFVQGAFGPSAYGDSPRLRGLFFSSGRQEGRMRSRLLDGPATFKDSCWMLPNTNEGLFLNDFFTTILPRERSLGRMVDGLFSGLSLRRHAGLLIPLVLLFMLCAYFSTSFMANFAVLQDARRELPRQLVLPDNLSGRVALLGEAARDIRAFEVQRGKHDWMLPGSSQTTAALAALKQRYAAWVRLGLLELDEAVIAATLAELPPERRRLALVYLCDYQAWAYKMLHAVKTGAEPPVVRDGVDSYGKDLAMLVPHAGSELSTVFEAYAQWETADERDHQMAQQGAKIDTYLDLLGTDLAWLPQWLNSRPSIGSVRPADFWPHAPEGVEVPPAYTVAGRQRLAELLQTLGAAARDKVRFSRLEQNFLRRYAADFRAAWWRLAEAFVDAAGHDDASRFWRLAPRMSGIDNPYFSLIREMAAAFSAIAGLGDSMPEDELPGAFCAVLDALYAEEQPQTLGATISRTGKELESRLSDEKARLRSRQNDARKLLADYLTALEELYNAARTDSDALDLAAAGYAGGKDKGAMPVGKALHAFLAFSASLDADHAVHGRFWRLVEGPLSWQIIQVVRRSACKLNEIWESTVLAQTASMPSDMLWEQLFGEQSTLKGFVTGPGKPFLRAGADGWYAARWLDIPYPVSKELLRFLDQGIDPARKAREKYEIKVTALPVNVNKGAEKPHRAQLRLECGAQPQILDNYNYENSGIFIWEPDKCGPVRLELDFGFQHLDMTWDGEWAFQDFLRDFRSGERILGPQDFPGREEVLKKLGVTEIRVRYRLDGAQEALKAQRYTSVGLPREAAVCRGRNAGEGILRGTRLPAYPEANP